MNASAPHEIFQNNDGYIFAVMTEDRTFTLFAIYR